MNYHNRLFNHRQFNRGTGSAEAKEKVSESPDSRDLRVDRFGDNRPHYDNTSVLLKQAARYRQMAQALPPNISGPQGKDYYLAKAAELEQQAQQDRTAESPPAARPDPIQIAARPAPTERPERITTPQQVTIHSYLAAAVIGDKRPNMHRAFSMWLATDRTDRTAFKFADVLDYFSQQTKTDPRTVRRWIKSGDGVFWNIDDIPGKTIVRFYGKNQVFANFKLWIPGRTLRVETSRLLGELKVLRAALYACFINRDSKWIARETITSITGVHERTQRNYDHVNSQKKRKTFAIGYRLETSDSDRRQLPNVYSAIFYPIDHKVMGDNRHGLYSPELYGLNTGDTVTRQRTLFDNANHAIDAARKRHKKGLTGECYSYLESTKKGSMILKTIPYAMA